MTATTATLNGRVTVRRRLPVMPFVVAGVALVGVVVLGFIGTNVWASLQQNALERRFDAAAAQWAGLDPVERSGVTVDAGAPIARLAIPTIGLDAIVVEGATPDLMRRAPGHLNGSATPGENGIAIITGNRVAFGGFFMRLDRLEAGDRIVTESPIGRTTFVVTEIRVVDASELDLGTDSSRRVLMLFGSERLVGGSGRLVVTAVAEGDTPS